MIAEPLLAMLLSTSENIHELKAWPESFELMWVGRKLFEARKNDRSFAVGDVLRLREWIPPRLETMEGAYTGRVIVADVTCILAGGTFGLPRELSVLGIRILGRRGDRDGPGEESTG